MKHTIALSAALLLALAGCATPPSDTATSASRTETCKAASEQDIAALFERWNTSLQTGVPSKMVALYAQRSILLPTMSNKLRVSAAEKEDYFDYFMANKPSGKVNTRMIEIGCNAALDAGIYTFSFASTGQQVVARYTYTYSWDGKQWLITSHHSSAMPEK